MIKNNPPNIIKFSNTKKIVEFWVFSSIKLGMMHTMKERIENVIIRERSSSKVRIFDQCLLFQYHWIKNLSYKAFLNKETEVLDG